MSDQLTPRHRGVLAAVRQQGSTRDHIGDYLTWPGLGELISGYIFNQPITGQETVASPGASGDIRIDVWYTTRKGAIALGRNPDLIGGA